MAGTALIGYLAGITVLMINSQLGKISGIDAGATRPSRSCVLSFMTLPTAVDAYLDWYVDRNGSTPPGLIRPRR